MNYPGTLVAKSDNVVLLGIPRKGIFDILSTDNSLRRTKSMVRARLVMVTLVIRATQRSELENPSGVQMSLSAASKEFIIKTMRFYKTFNVSCSPLLASVESFVLGQMLGACCLAGQHVLHLTEIAVVGRFSCRTWVENAVVEMPG